MTNLRNSLFTSRNFLRFMVLVTGLGLVAILTPISSRTAPALSLTLVNNSSQGIQHLYLAPAGTDNWGDDQLSTPINPGATRSLNLSWNEATVKLVAEDQDGCFMTTTVEAGSSAEWTITGDTARNCGN
jgi:hypothetical protein